MAMHFAQQRELGNVRKGNQKRQWVVQCLGSREQEVRAHGTLVLEQRLRQTPVEKLSWDEAEET